MMKKKKIVIIVQRGKVLSVKGFIQTTRDRIGIEKNIMSQFQLKSTFM